MAIAARHPLVDTDRTVRRLELTKCGVTVVEPVDGSRVVDVVSPPAMESNQTVNHGMRRQT